MPVLNAVFDTEQRRFEDEDGRPLSDAEVRKEIEDYIEKEKRQVNRQAEKLLVGALTVAAFFEFLRFKVTGWHSVAGTIAYGGESQMGDVENERINRRILSELTFLQGFEAQAEMSFIAAERLAELASQIDIPTGLESVVKERVAEALRTAAPSEAEAIIKTTVREALADSLGVEAASVAETVTVDASLASDLIGATIPSRSQMYADATYSTFENSVKERETDAGAVGVRRVSEADGNVCEDCEAWASDEYVPLSEIQDIGSGICGSRDRCTFEFSYEGIEPLTIDRRLTG